MIKSLKSGASSIGVIAMTLGILGCLVGVGYTFYSAQQEAGQEGGYRLAADRLRLLSQQLAENSRASVRGGEGTFIALREDADSFSTELASIDAEGLATEVGRINERWIPVQKATQALVEAGPRVDFVNSVSTTLAHNMRPIQAELGEVVDSLARQPVSPQTMVAAQKSMWLAERIGRNVDRILVGAEDSDAAADEFRNDVASFTRILAALGNGDVGMGVDKVSGRRAVESLNNVTSLFSPVSSSVRQVAGSVEELQGAAEAREAVARNANGLSDAVSALAPAIEKMNASGVSGRGTLMALIGAPGLLALGLLVLLYRSQHNRVRYTELGVAEINRALVKIAEGDLTVRVSEDNSVTRDIAREINASTQRQRELIRNIKTPFKISSDGITQIGASAEGQVDKGRELTQSVVESAAATTEMVRTSEEIKTSTAEAARTSERNRQRVTQGYELTKDMSKASADVREAVQATSKSAKRQGELIQSVTAAAEYIQALNTKISVVAINTRIEAEKAGEHGRPFLGIAEAIGDLLREAEEEGRKIISEVRMLQNLSADNLSSMEKTVGTVVTILEYIDRLDSSLEEINAGSSAITAIINSVDDAAGQSANTARHMNNSMEEIRQRNMDISEYSESTREGVKSLQASMRDVAESLKRFRIEDESSAELNITPVQDLKSIKTAKKIYKEGEMKALEASRKELA